LGRRYCSKQQKSFSWEKLLLFSGAPIPSKISNIEHHMPPPQGLGYPK
jgi:hypothetical protein